MKLSGQGSMKQRDLIVVVDEKRQTKDGSYFYVDAQLNAMGLDKTDHQTDLHAYTKRKEIELDGAKKTVWENHVGYTKDQVADMKKVAGDNVVDLGDGRQVLALKADLIPRDAKQYGQRAGVGLNTKTLAASEIKIGEDIFDHQKAKVADSKVHYAEQRKQIEAPVAETDAPEVKSNVAGTQMNFDF